MVIEEARKKLEATRDIIEGAMNDFTKETGLEVELEVVLMHGIGDKSKYYVDAKMVDYARYM